MRSDAEPRSKHAPADQEYLDGLSARQLMDFRNYLFTPTYIAHNAAKFLDHEWVDIAELRKYLQHAAAIPPPSPPFSLRAPVDASKPRAREQSESDNPSTTALLTSTPTHQEAPPPPPVDCVQPSFDSTFGFDDDMDSFLASLGAVETDLSFFAQDTSMGQFSSYDPSLDPIFGFAGGDFNTLIPTSSRLPSAGLVDESATMYGYPGALADTTASYFTASSGSFAPAEPLENQLPSLPPPPPDSPPVASTPAEPRTETVQKSRRVRKEVDEANIVTSTRSRAPTARKRLAEGEISEQPRKKAKSLPSVSTS
ncbi:hypothetical protein DFH06DRAFT_1296159 [Mycena polygramma]|nr:hypothetical protein DFH06DRAFT_1296159 [Mycena polygramma]